LDTSEKYVEMCRKANEIQAVRIYEDGSWYAAEFNWLFTGLICTSCDDEHGCKSEFTEKSFWLPRQDQLQEMVDRNDLIVGFYKYATGNDQNCELSLSRADLSGSMEQLWLAFVMKTKYNKSWNGENWILDKT
jgi:hypothetical protein